MHRVQILLLLHILTIWSCVHILMSAFMLTLHLGLTQNGTELFNS